MKFDAIGKTYGRLTVVADDTNTARRMVVATCACGSGGKLYRLSHLVSGCSTSCGCVRRETTRQKATSHGLSNTQTYRAWSSLIQRCTNPAVHNYANYGGRGITVCDRWSTFENFVADMGEKPAGKSIDRIDGDGPYSPENCRWSTASEQAVNRKTTKWVVLDGKRMPITYASRALGYGELAVTKRIARGWPIERALDGRGMWAIHKMTELSALNETLRRVQS